MIVTCEACFTSFNVSDELIKPSGSKVRCSKCHKVFKAYPPIPEDIDPPPVTELSDPVPAYSLTPPQMPRSDQTGKTTVFPEAFKDIAEFDISELDQLLQEDTRDKSEMAFPAHETPPPSVSVPLSDEPSETSDTQMESGISEISLDMPEIPDRLDVTGAEYKTPAQMAAEDTDLLSDKADEALELALSEITLDEAFDGSGEESADVIPEPDTERGSHEAEPQDFSLDDFEKSLEMDFSDISLVSEPELESTAEQKAGASETPVKTDHQPEDGALSEEHRIDFDEIEALEISSIEGLMEKQEPGADAFNEGLESFQRTDAAVVSPPHPLTEHEEPLEMDARFLDFDELQLDTDDLKSASLLEAKESPKPRAEIPASPSVPSPAPKPSDLEDHTEDRKIKIPADSDIEEELEDTIPAAKKGMSPAIRIAIILAVLVAAGFGGIMLLKSMGISVPFISQSAPANVSDPGNLNIKSFDISSRFVDNDKIGKLFVITGKVKNEYTTARGSIQISGKIYTKDKALAKMETVFCGNMISDAELSKIDSAALNQRLQNKSGDNHINQKVLPGAAIPFTIVFRNLPANLEEFTTEVTSSIAA